MNANLSWMNQTPPPLNLRLKADITSTIPTQNLPFYKKMKFKAVRWSYQLYRNTSKDMFHIPQQLTRVRKRETANRLLLFLSEINNLLSLKTFRIAFATDKTIID